MQQGKLMTAGEGGALIGNDQALLEAAWNYADCGRERGRWFYHHASIGSNCRMTEWQGAVLLGQLERFPAQHATRNANAIALGEALAEIPGLRAQKRDERMDSQGNYCFVVHFDHREFANMPLRRVRGGARGRGHPARRQLPVALRSRALPHGELRADAAFARARRATTSDLLLPVAEHAAASTVWLEHRILLADRDRVLRVAEAAARIQEHAAAIMEKMPIGAGA